MEVRPGQGLLTLTMAGALLLTGCSGGESAGDRLQAVQAAYGRLKQFSAQAEVTADYGERVYGYNVAIEGSLDAGAMTVTEPENIAGTVLTWTDGETELEYDGAELDTGALSGSGLSPADAMPAVLKACKSGAAVDCCSDTLDEQEVLYATLDPGNQDGCQIFCWFQPESYALSRAEIAQDGQVIITLSFTEFSFQTTEDTETK